MNGMGRVKAEGRQMLRTDPRRPRPRSWREESEYNPLPLLLSSTIRMSGVRSRSLTEWCAWT